MEIIFFTADQIVPSISDTDNFLKKQQIKIDKIFLH